MKATLLLDQRVKLSDSRFVELVIWKLPKPLAGSAHSFKYRLAFVVNGRCVLRYDNEAGKGDHKHIGEVEVPYSFASPPQAVDDFQADVTAWKE